MMGQIEVERTDEEIAREVQAGKMEAFGILVRRYEEKMMRYSRKFLFGYDDAADVVQEVFLKAYVNIQSFNASKKFSSWLYRIAHNEFINAIKKRGREHLSLFDLDTLFPHPVSQENIDKEMSSRELRESLDSLLGKLDVKYREVLVLYCFEEMNYREIADILHIPVATVGIRLQRGRQIIKHLYERQYK
jgi:RNA polymerase sigma-70 factor (ECF subfamily)